MKTIRTLVIIATAAFAVALFIPALLAQAASATVIAYDPPAPQFDLAQFLAGIAVKYPKLGALIALMGALRLVIKPICAGIRASRGEWLQHFDESDQRHIAQSLLKWVTSVDLSKIKRSGSLIALLLLPLVLFTGCMTGNRAVPGNHIKGVFFGQPFELDNPKNFTGKGMSLNAHAGTNSMEFKFDEFSSTNDPQVIDKAYAGQVALMKEMRGLLNDVTQAAMQAAMKALTAQNTNSSPGAIVNAPPKVIQNSAPAQWTTPRKPNGLTLAADVQTKGAFAVPASRGFTLPPSWFARQRKDGSIAVRFESAKDEPFIVKHPEADLWSDTDIRAHITSDHDGKMYLDGHLVRCGQVRNWGHSTTTSRDTIVVDVGVKPAKVLHRLATIGE